MSTTAPSNSEVNPVGFDPYGASTHAVFNQPTELTNYNLFAGDAALREGVAREGANWASDGLARARRKAGLGRGSRTRRARQSLAAPKLDTHDRYGHRIDLVRYHPAYHELMRLAVEEGLHASPWTDPRPGAHVARAARYYLQAQVEAGHGCPITMTFAATPCIAKARTGAGAPMAAESPRPHL